MEQLKITYKIQKRKYMHSVSDKKLTCCWKPEYCLKKKKPQYLPKKTVCVIHPLVYELCSDGLRIVWKSDVLQGVQK